MSCSIRLTEVDALLANEAGKLQLISAFGRARKLRSMESLFGFTQHPEWLRIVSKPKAQQAGLEKAVNAIMYGNDVSLLYLDMAGPEQQHRKRQKRDDAARKKFLLTVNPKQRLTHNAVTNSTFLQHLSAELMPGNFYFMPLEYSQLQSAVKSLDQAQRLPADAPPSLPRTAEAEMCVALNEPALEVLRECSAADSEDIAQEHVFFKVLTSRAAGLRTVRAAVAGKQRLRRGDISITFHRATFNADRGSFVVQSQPSTCSESGALVHVLSGVGASIGHISQMLQWERSGETVLSLSDVGSSAAERLLQALMDAGSVEGKDSPGLQLSLLDDGSQAEAKRLQEHGWLIETDTGLRLSLAALQRMSVGQILQQPFPMGIPDDDVPLKDYSTFQLCRHLGSQGWAWQRLSKHADPYQPGALKLWYTAGPTVHREYLLSFAMAEDIFQAQDGVTIAHGKPVRYYRLLLDGELVFGLQA